MSWNSIHRLILSKVLLAFKAVASNCYGLINLGVGGMCSFMQFYFCKLLQIRSIKKINMEPKKTRQK